MIFRADILTKLYLPEIELRKYLQMSKRKMVGDISEYAGEAIPFLNAARCLQWAGLWKNKSPVKN